MLKLEDIKAVYKNHDSQGGYSIEFEGGGKIQLTKRRTIIALLVLIKNGTGSESDLAQGNTVIPEIRGILQGKMPDEFVQDYYGDANKPFSELWNEEGFTFIDNLKGGRSGRSQAYTLHPVDHIFLFSVAKKALRKAPSVSEKETIRLSQKGRCNLCGSRLFITSSLLNTTYAKDRRREVFDHRLPVERGGDSLLDNYQALCFYCNKCKWQMCNICQIKGCDPNCALRNPEHSRQIAPTGEDISDVLIDREFFLD